MNLQDVKALHRAGDSVQLEDLYQLVATGDPGEWRFELLDKAVDDALLSAYGEVEQTEEITSLG